MSGVIELIYLSLHVAFGSLVGGLIPVIVKGRLPVSLQWLLWISGMASIMVVLAVMNRVSRNYEMAGTIEWTGIILMALFFVLVFIFTYRKAAGKKPHKESARERLGS